MFAISVMDKVKHIFPPVLNRWHDATYWVVLVLACVTFMVMNVFTTFKEDDMAFSLVEGEWTPVHSILDVLRSHVNVFFHANGRTANLVASFFCAMLGKTVFNVCNTLVFGFLAHMISLLATGRRSLLSLSVFLVAVGTCYPVPGETMLWLDGSCNYMWAITLSMTLVYYLSRPHQAPLGWGRGVMLLMAAFIAGSFNEATSFGFLLGLIIYYVFNRHRIDRRVVIALSGYLLGVILIVASPGAWARAVGGDIVVNLPLTDLLHSRWFIFSEKMLRFYIPVVAVVVGILALLLRRGKAVKQSPWTFVFLGLAVVLFALGQTHERVYAPLFTVALMISIIAADVLLNRWQWGRMAVIIVCLGLAGFTAARGVTELNRYKVYDNQTVSEILAATEQAVLHERVYDGYSRFIKPMNYISTNFFAHEDIYRAFYGKKNVQFVSDSVYVRYHEGRLLDEAQVLQPRDGSSTLFGRVYMFDHQDYIVIGLMTDQMPNSMQTAELHAVSMDSIRTVEEQRRRYDYGINIDYEPVGFYPLDYQGQLYLICKKPQSLTGYIVFPMSFTLNTPPALYTLYF